MAEDGPQRRSLRILLIGRTGDGKSSTGNSILGKEVFKTSGATKSVTQKCEAGKENRFGRSIEVVDTPGIFDTQRRNSHIRKELLRALCMTTPGFHAIIYVMRPSRFTEEAQNVKKLFFQWFGDNVSMYLILLITNRTTENIKEFLDSDPHPEFMNLIQMCQDRILPFDNTALGTMHNDKQVKELLSVIDKMIESNDNRCFSNEVYELAKQYACSKGTEPLTNDSIRILQSAGLSQIEIERKWCCILENTTNNTMYNESLAESDMITKPQGNLLIIDAATNLPYDKAASHIKINNDDVESSSNDDLCNCRRTTDVNTDEEDKNITRNMTATPNSLQQNIADEHLEKQNKRTHLNRRRDRKVDPSGTSYLTENAQSDKDVSRNESKINIDTENESALEDDQRSNETHPSSEEAYEKFRNRAQTDEGLNKFEQFLRFLKSKCTIL